MSKSKTRSRINKLIQNIKKKEIELKRLNNQLNNQLNNKLNNKLMRQNSRTNRDILNNRQKMNNAKPKLTFKKRRKMKKTFNQDKLKY
jgi:hypothetical protein